MCEKIDKKIYKRYNGEDLRYREQFCCECLENVSFTNPCPVCRGVESPVKVKKLPKLEGKRKYTKSEIVKNRDLKEKRCSRCNKIKPTSEFYLNKRGQFEGRCKQCLIKVNSEIQKKKRKEKNRKMSQKDYEKYGKATLTQENLNDGKICGILDIRKNKSE